MEKESRIKKYFEAWTQRDWDFVSENITEDFTFTSSYDDHLNREEYKKKCWDIVKEIGKFDFVSIMENENEAFVRYQNQINGEKVQNVEHFIFENGKLKEVTVFFGLPEK